MRIQKKQNNQFRQSRTSSIVDLKTQRKQFKISSQGRYINSTFIKNNHNAINLQRQNMNLKNELEQLRNKQVMMSTRLLKNQKQKIELARQIDQKNAQINWKKNPFQRIKDDYIPTNYEQTIQQWKNNSIRKDMEIKNNQKAYEYLKKSMKFTHIQELQIYIKEIEKQNHRLKQITINLTKQLSNNQYYKLKVQELNKKINKDLQKQKLNEYNIKDLKMKKQKLQELSELLKQKNDIIYRLRKQKNRIEKKEEIKNKELCQLKNYSIQNNQKQIKNLMKENTKIKAENKFINEKLQQYKKKQEEFYSQNQALQKQNNILKENYKQKIQQLEKLQKLYNERDKKQVEINESKLKTNRKPQKSQVNSDDTEEILRQYEQQQNSTKKNIYYEGKKKNKSSIKPKEKNIQTDKDILRNIKDIMSYRLAALNYTYEDIVDLINKNSIQKWNVSQIKQILSKGPFDLLQQQIEKVIKYLYSENEGTNDKNLTNKIFLKKIKKFIVQIEQIQHENILIIKKSVSKIIKLNQKEIIKKMKKVGQKNTISKNNFIQILQSFGIGDFESHYLLLSASIHSQDMNHLQYKQCFEAIIR